MNHKGLFTLSESDNKSDIVLEGLYGFIPGFADQAKMASISWSLGPMEVKANVKISPSRCEYFYGLNQLS